ncbi:MAG: hypothetical protein IVW36_08950 [Dehalococcoidia bacterium]|nr:hypothetical protein [Dehalococcoidia bacterium]
MPDYARRIAQRTLVGRDPALLQLLFDASVLERYRGRAGWSVIRTDSAGRVKQDGGWSLDFGIAEGDATVHASFEALTQNLPDAEREHWAAHALAPGLRENFLRMQLAPGSCFDDGDVRTW